MGGQVLSEPVRKSSRREQILNAAADLVSRHGYHSVSMADIGAAAGIVGPAIYRHFSGKAALLVALFDGVADRLLARTAEVVEVGDEREALARLVADQVSLVIEDRELAIVFYREVHNLPAEDRRRLRRKQRLYLEEWVHVVAELRRELDEAEVRTLVHAAIGAVQSVLHHPYSGLPEERTRALLVAVGHSVLGIEPSD